jgi:hypothetical protein
MLSRFHPGSTGTIAPHLLQAGRQKLDGNRILISWRLREEGRQPPPIEITPDGVIYDGNNRAWVAAARGEVIPYRVIDYSLTGQGPVQERPLFWPSGRPAQVPWEDAAVPDPPEETLEESPRSRVARLLRAIWRLFGQ